MIIWAMSYQSPDFTYYNYRDDTRIHPLMGQVIESRGHGVASLFTGYANIRGQGKSQHFTRLGPFTTLEEAKAAVEAEANLPW